MILLSHRNNTFSHINDTTAGNLKRILPVHRANYFNIWKHKNIKPKTPININKSDKFKGEKSNIKETNYKQRALPLTSHNGFILPSTDLLVDQKISDETPDDNILNSNAKLLEGVLKDYSIEGLIETVQYGPVVTRYDLKPAPGLRSQRVISLSDAIAR